MLHINSFVRRQTKESPFSYFDGSWEDLLKRIEASFATARPGYRDGVVLVDIDPTNVYSGVVQLVEGTPLVGTFKARRAGEEPRKEILARGTKTPASSAYAVMYRSDVLAEDGDNELPSSTDNWELISLNASPVEGEMPIAPDTLIANHFHLSGGTETHMTNDEFVDALRNAVLFWKDKAMAASE